MGSQFKRNIACLGGHRVKLGMADLGRTVLRTRDDAGSSVPVETLRDSQQTTVYLAWNPRRNDLSVQDDVGLPPAVESAVFTINPAVAGDYYLAVDPQLGIDRSRRAAR